MLFIKDQFPFNIGIFKQDYLNQLSNIKSPKDLTIKRINHTFANDFVLKHHYLKRKLYIGRNIEYGLFIKNYCVGVIIYGDGVWYEKNGLVPPLQATECPELKRLATLSGLPKNTETYFIAKTIKLLLKDWKDKTGLKPKCITSFCDIAYGFNGSLYKAANFTLFDISKRSRPTNPGSNHGKRGGNTYSQKPLKQFWVYYV